MPDIGDTKLWESVSAAMHRADDRLLSLIVHQVKIGNWPLSGLPATGHRATGMPGFFVRLGYLRGPAAR